MLKEFVHQKLIRLRKKVEGQTTKTKLQLGNVQLLLYQFRGGGCLNQNADAFEGVRVWHLDYDVILE